MGANTWMLAYLDGRADEILKSRPPLDRAAAEALAKRLFVSQAIETIDDGSLAYTCPHNRSIYVGCFPGLSIVAAGEFALDYPSRLRASYLNAPPGSTVYLHVMQSVVDHFAYAIWEKGELVRSLSLCPDKGILEDIGLPRAFEEPYWSGHHPLPEEAGCDPYPLPFHPLDMGEAALLWLFGYQLEGVTGGSPLIDPNEIALCGFKRRRLWWMIW